MQPSYYRSSSGFEPNKKQNPTKKISLKPKWRPSSLAKIIVIIIVGLLITMTGKIFDSKKPDTHVLGKNKIVKSVNLIPYNQATIQKSVNRCANNTLPQLVLVSINQRHLWVCNASNQLYDSPVVTGISYLAADNTPVGTFQILNKDRNLTLTGTDTTGHWSDPVSYWMHFLTNQYGQYGLHDATWRPPYAFGNISPNSSQASHGCVELPLSTAQWLYNWINVGATVKIVQ